MSDIATERAAIRNPLTGILPVAPTPFHPDGSLDIPGMRRVLDCMIDQGADAICILANYSEQFALSDEERATLTRRCLEHVAGRRPVIVAISHFSTALVVERAKSAQAMGASMVMMMPPYHGATLTASEAAVFQHFSMVSDAITIPIMVQDAPLSGVHMSAALLARMAREIEQVRYFKLEYPFAAEKLSELIQIGGDYVEGPFDGEEAVTLLADLDAGATGTMTSALLPDKIRPIVTHYLAGEKDLALAQWEKCLPLINHENRQCGWRGCKTVFMEGGIIGSDHVRHPQVSLSPRTKERLLQLARDLNLLALDWGK